MRRHCARTPDDGANKPCRPEPTEDADVRAGRVLLAASRVLSEDGVYGLIFSPSVTRRKAVQYSKAVPPRANGHTIAERGAKAGTAYSERAMGAALTRPTGIAPLHWHALVRRACGV